MAKTRVLGLDLGTSNSALAMAETAAVVEMAGVAAGSGGAAAGLPEPGHGATGTPSARARVLPVTQVMGAGRVGERRTFASALYFPVTGQFPTGSLRPPWSAHEPPYVAGDFARETGAQSPERLVTSAKSWLSYRSVDPTRPILPWGAGSGEGRVSPLEASRIYLEHLKESFLSGLREEGDGGDAPQNASGKAAGMASGKPLDGRLEETQVVLTVPASFDEVARKLTLQAAREAGLGDDVVLLEEPQAAFYAWLDAVGPAWREQIRPGDTVLVCDVGGGTCDFSLIAVSERDGELDLERVAVGRHILLGGDNMDLALAFALRQRLEGEGRSLDDWQFQALIQACRVAKETLFDKADLAEIPVSIPSRGSGLLSGTVSATLPRSLLEAIIVDGFFALTRPDEMPAARPGAGLRELGLPYEADAVLSKHLAAFLARGKAVADALAAGSAPSKAAPPKPPAAGPAASAAPGGAGMLRPDAVLFNGGVFRPARLRQRVLELLESWSPSRPVRELAGADPDLAVARGAAAYGLAKLTGRGVRIRAGASRSYYIGLDPTMPAIPGYRPPVKALCVVPLGMEEGTEQVLADREFGLTTGSTVAFRFFSSPSRAADRVGSVVADAERDLEETSRLEMTLPAVEGLGDSAMVPVQLHARLSELGTLELWMQRKDADDRWQLDFDVRTA